MAIHVKTDFCSTLVNKSTNPELFYDDGDEGMTLKGMQSLVNGPIQIVRLTLRVICNGVGYTHLGFNEEGKFSQQTINTVASKIARECSGVAADDFIVGDAVLFEESELN